MYVRGITIANLRSFLARAEVDRLFHRVDADCLTLLTLDECEHCGIKMVGANLISIRNKDLLPDVAAAIKSMFPATDCRAGGGCNDDGDVVCSDCHQD
jgi:hypothetical protein